MTADTTSDTAKLRRRHRKVAAGAGLLACAMVGLSFAVVPLYRIFCQVTGYAGTTQRVEAPSDRVLDRMIQIRFDANTSPNLAWDFEPVVRTIDVPIGANHLAFYKATNNSDRAVTGTATFNVTPEIAGSYFNKVECFCFTEQMLRPGESVDMPVSFFIDPDIVDDPDARGVTSITLSYTFFAVEKSAAKADPGRGG